MPDASSEGQILQRRLLLVEGRDDKEFLRRLCDHIDVAGVQIESHGGRDNLRRRIKGLQTRPRFEDLRDLGIIRDADENADNAFQSVRGALLNAGLSSPDGPGVFTGGIPRVSVLIMPPERPSGCLETLLWETVKERAGTECVGEFIGCADIPDTGNRSVKAKVHAYIAMQKMPGLKIGEATGAGYFNLDHPSLNTLKDYLRSLSA